MKDEALRLALEALKTCQIDGDGWSGPDYWFDDKKVGKAINAAEQALEQPEPEPVAWMMVNPTHLPNSKSLHWEPQQWHISWEAVPLYTYPPKREPLTDDQEIQLIAELAMVEASGSTDGVARLGLAGAEEALAIFQAAHGIKGEA